MHTIEKFNGLWYVQFETSRSKRRLFGFQNVLMAVRTASWLNGAEQPDIPEGHLDDELKRLTGEDHHAQKT